MADNKKKKRRSWAWLVYLLTFSIFFAAIGSGAYLVLDRYILTGDDSTVSDDTNDGYIPLESDSITTLFVLADSDKNVSGIILSRFIPVESSLRLVPIPKQTAYGEGTIEDEFKANGISALITTIASEYDVMIEKYMVLTPEGFASFSDSLGGTPYTIPSDMYYRDDEGNLTSFTQGLTDYNMSGEDLLRLINYPLYEQGVSFNNKIVGDITATLLNHASSQRTDLPSMLQSLYLNLFNNSDTNISAADFAHYKAPIEYVLDYNSSPVIYKIAFGTWEQEKFSPSTDGIADIKAFFLIEE